MIIDFTQRENQSNLLYASVPSIKPSSNLATNSSTITTGSSIKSGASSIFSTEESFPSSDPYNLSFLTENHKYYQKLLYDLSIIDNIGDLIDVHDEANVLDSSSLCDNKHFIDTARHVARKQQVLEAILVSETNYVNNLCDFHDTFAVKIETWLNEITDKDVIAKFNLTSSRKDLNLLFHTIHDLMKTHKDFLTDLKERLDLWGPTQMCADVLNKLYDSLTIYEPFMRHHPDFVMALDIVYRLPTMAKSVNMTLEETNKTRASSLQVQDILHYLHEPLHRLTVYTKALKQLSHYSDLSYHDYTNLLDVSQKFTSLENEWAKKVQDCQSHLMVLEAYRTIQDCPITININRRLLLFAHLIKVDLDNVTLTTDIRMYFLYNDSLIYCKRQKENNKKKDGDGDTTQQEKKKLIYKGTLALRGANVRLLAPSFLAKLVEVKKPMFRIGKKAASDSNSLPGAEAFGFELVTTEINIDAMSSMYNFQGATLGAGTSIKRRHVLRTRSLAENNVWIESLRNAIRAANAVSI